MTLVTHGHHDRSLHRVILSDNDEFDGDIISSIGEEKGTAIAVRRHEFAFIRFNCH